MTHWFPDNSVLVNFAHLSRLDLIRGYLRENGRVVEAVADEIRDSTGHVPAMADIDITAWFGKPIRLRNQTDQSAIEGIRRHRFGGDYRKPREHLGESQTLYVINTKPKYRDSVWLTEDGSAYRFAKDQGIPARNTFEILCDMVGAHDIDSTTAYAYMIRLHELERRLCYLPREPAEFVA